MDRKGKKSKAERRGAAMHSERSDTKTQSHDTLERMNADALVQRARGGNSGARGPQSGKRSGHRG